ncbi:MAG: DUF2189 domain-containing protein [Magnetospirillum sp. WYHS-4]
MHANVPMEAAPGRDPAREITIRQVSVDRSMTWLVRAWADFKATPGISLTLGGLFVAASWVLAIGLSEAGLGSLIPAMAGGFLLVAPMGAVAFYEVARRRESGAPLALRLVLATCLRHPGPLAAMGMVLALAYMAWLEIALFLFAAFYGRSPPGLETFLVDLVASPQGATFLLAGVSVGVILSLAVFSIAAVSIPLLHDRPVDVVTAIRTSVRAVAENRGAMLGWGLTVGFIALCGLATFFVGLAFAMPLLGYATWHAYRDLVEDQSL